MGISTLILGESGTGKSASLRNLKTDDSFLIKVIEKPLPFKSYNWKRWESDANSGSMVVTDYWETIIKCLKGTQKHRKKIIIIDDFQYVMSNEFMRRSDDKKTFEKFTEIGRHAWEIFVAAQQTPEDVRVYFLSHTEETPTGKVKIKTIGKMLDEKVTVEGMFAIVLRTLVRDGKYLFTTQNNGIDTVKSPMDMFSSLEIENDLNIVDSAICSYYDIPRD